MNRAEYRKHSKHKCVGCDYPIYAPSAEVVLQTPQTYGKSINPDTEIVSDLISKQDAINCCSCLHPEECWDEIRKLPSAVEVVRCKDCRHRQEDECPMFFEEQIDIDEGDGYYDTGYIVHDYTQDDGFCSWGERREP